jgi:hypothetical protein
MRLPDGPTPDYTKFRPFNIGRSTGRPIVIGKSNESREGGIFAVEVSLPTSSGVVVGKLWSTDLTRLVENPGRLSCGRPSILLERTRRWRSDDRNDHQSIPGDITMWRHGDVLIAQADSIPVGARPLPHCILAEGELTGHSHRIEGSGVAELFEFGGERFLKVLAESARVIHQEHQTITLPRGTYRVWGQREYTPEAIVRVRD